MLTIAIPVVAILAMACAGRLRNLGTIRLRHAWLLLALLGLKVLITEVLHHFDVRLLTALHIAMYVAGAGWLVLNRHLPGIWLIGLGGASNALVITANGGTMPATEAAYRTAGFAVTPGEWENSSPVTDAHLPWLGDVFAIPSYVPLANVFSVGDLLIWLGMAWFLYRVGWPRREKAGADRTSRHPVRDSTTA